MVCWLPIEWVLREIFSLSIIISGFNQRNEYIGTYSLKSLCINSINVLIRLIRVA